MIVIQIAYIK